MIIPPSQIKISLITAPEFNLEYLWWLTILFFVLAVTYLIGVFIIRNKIKLKNSRTKEKKIEFSPMINEFLFYEDSNTKEEKMNYLNLKIQIRELIKNTFDRDVLTEVLLDLRKDLSGNSQKVLINLYKDLGLHHDAYEKLRSKKWQVVSSGILELTTMEVEDSYGLIIKFINHRQRTIRKQAEIAIVSLKKEGVRYFLDNTKYKIAEWQQLKLLDVLRHKPNYTPPQFALWLTSTNAHVVLFALRLIKYYSQNDAEQSIITLLMHKERDIQAEAIECIKDFHFVNALPTLKLVYPKASHDIKIAILDAIGELGTIADVPFLENLQRTERNFNIKSKVIGTLNKIDPESILPTTNISSPDFYDVEGEILDHVNDQEIIDKEVLKEETILESELQPEEIKKKDALDHIDFNFLPDLIDEDVVKQSNQVVITVHDLEPDHDLEEVLSFNFLPLIIDETTFQDKDQSTEQDDFEPIFVLNDLPVEEEHIDITIGQQNGASDININNLDGSFLNKKATNKGEIKNASAEETLISFENERVSFSPNFMCQEELDAMVLLENISELGDCRELLLLYQIIEAHSSDVVIDRANELIQKFSYESLRPGELFSENYNLAESVFTDVYHLADHETKLLLLDEMMNVGDHKEIHLLEGILDSTSKSLVKKATKVLEHIKSQTSVATEAPISTLKEDFFFKVDFELELNEPTEYKGTAPINNGYTLFDQLCSMSNSLYNKING
ncbi:HEAT repeat domain-containing protein [Maribacter ulvicola]|uniref:HEAT repeat-containing protein n=1 Tax=Maribacter ulvicola TaxID=228959 RepID=A0A1N6YXM8_9FLAO|nr:HEAT repeat domain-containing protein [Maribacter ulvicola]SIR19327.1 hypothetical protein SAMN05421797_107192 [Maribacter ulvicola]